MKNTFSITGVFLFIFLTLFNSSCKKDKPTPNSPIVFNTNLTYGTVTDIDGNDYKTITVGTQTWMAENLKTTRYFNGANIELINTTNKWDALSLTSIAYCWNGDNINNKAVYGALYTWAAAMNGSPSSTSKPSGIQGVCPTDWHLPSDAEWATLVTYIGGYLGDSADKLKEAGTAHWQSPNTGATNSSGFTALPGGMRYIDEAFHGQTESGAFEGIGGVGSWWSSTEYDPSYGLNQTMTSWYSTVFKEHHEKQSGLSVRCVKD